MGGKVVDDGGESKAKAAITDKPEEAMPWFKKYPRAYLDGTRALRPEERGIYEDCLCLIYLHDRELPKNDAWMAYELHVNARVWRRVRDKLLACGKLIDTGTGYTNNRAQIEVEARRVQRSKRATSAEHRENIRRIEPELPLDFNARRAQLRSVPTTSGPQEVLHARARLDLDQEKEDRSFIPTGNDDPKTRPAQLPRFVSEAALDEARAHANGWDRQALLAKFLEWPGSKNAVDMDKAFIGWVKKFTKGRAA